MFVSPFAIVFVIADVLVGYRGCGFFYTKLLRVESPRPTHIPSWTVVFFCAAAAAAFFVCLIY